MPAPSAVISETHLHLPNPLQDNKTGTCLCSSQFGFANGSQQVDIWTVFLSLTTGGKKFFFSFLFFFLSY